MTDADKVKRYEALLARVANLPTIRGHVGAMSVHAMQALVNKQCSIIDAVQAELVASVPPPGLLKLYYIYHSTDSGNDLTMFLRATSPEAAYGHWRLSVERDGEQIDPDESIYIRTVPPAVGKYGKVDWPDIVVTMIPSERGA